MLSPQDKFDSVMLLVTETVSSEEYLNYYGIHRSEPLNTKAWESFVNKVIKQDQKLVPGIYPRSFVNGVHYYAVRKESNHLICGNGYPNAGGIGLQYGRALNAQPDRSHGLCQTFALMFMHNNEGMLLPGKYQTNVLIGLKWLKEFTKTHTWLLPYEGNNVQAVQLDEQGDNRLKRHVSLKTLLPKWPASKLYVENGVKFVYLSHLIEWLMDIKNLPLLQAWAVDLHDS